MNYYAAIYTVSIILSLASGLSALRKYRNLSGWFFFLFTVFGSAWFLLYFLFFSGIDDVETLLFLSRLNFWISLGANYSLLLFIYFFDTKPSRIFTRDMFVLLTAYGLILFFHAFTPLIIQGLAYSTSENVYREIPGIAYALNPGLHLMGLFLFGYSSIRQFKKQAYLNRIRLKRILSSAFLPLFAAVVFQLILPAFGIWMLEKELILFYLFFTVYVFYVLRRYYFSIGYGLGNILVIVAAVAVSIIFLNGLKFGYALIGDWTLADYWNFADRYSIIDTIIGIMLFSQAYRIFRRIFLWGAYKLELEKKIQNLEQAFSRTTNLIQLNERLRQGMASIFKTRYSEIRIFEDTDMPELRKYFENELTDKIFINDVVFIEERKSKFDKTRLLKEIPEDTAIIFPLFDRGTNGNIGIFILWSKPFGDFYMVDEIELLRDFSFSLELHVRHIKTYARLEDLSVNLDRKIDEKTIEYNILINQQKEFISVISHEIKAPITNAVFQSDSILDDLETGISKEALKEELEILNSQLIKAGELLTKLFSVQYYDTRSVSLFREDIQIGPLLRTEYEIYSRMHPEIQFIDQIDEKLGSVSIDRIQFQQVLSNLLQNAVKFLDKTHSVIALGAFRDKKFLYVEIEDNGRGFGWADTERLFERYSTGSGKSVGLGMGLYLCRKIVEMHGGEIRAGVSEKFGWAKFSIKIPTE